MTKRTGPAVAAAGLGFALGATMLAGCIPSPDPQNPPVLLREIATAPGATSQPSTTATPSHERTPMAPDPSAGPEARLTAETFAAEVGAAIADKGSVHMESTISGGPNAGTAVVDYAYSPGEVLTEGGAGGLAYTVPNPTYGKIQYILTKDGAFANLGEETDNKYYSLGAGWSDPAVATLQITVDSLAINSAVLELDGNISDFMLVSGPVNVRGFQAYEYVITVPTSTVPDQLGVTALIEIRKNTEQLERDPQVDAALAEIDANLASLPATTEFHYWIGPGLLPVKLTYQAFGTTSETIMYKWGEVGPVVTPSGDQYGGVLDW